MKHEATEKSRIEAPLVRAIEKRNETQQHPVFQTKISGNPFQDRGFPDRLLCYRGYFIVFELKRRPGMKGSKLQMVTMRDIRRSGGIAKIPDTVEEALAVFDAIDNYEDDRISWKHFKEEVH